MKPDWLSIILCSSAIAHGAFRAEAVEVPPGFITETLATNLNAATAIARGICGSVMVFLRRASAAPDLSDHDDNSDETVAALKRLTHSYTPRPRVLSCVCDNPIDVVQLFESPGLVVIGGEMRWWWPSAEQRLAHALTRLGCHVTFVHVPRSRFVPPLVAAARETFEELRARPWVERAEALALGAKVPA